ENHETLWRQWLSNVNVKGGIGHHVLVHTFLTFSHKLSLRTRRLVSASGGTSILE
ncbi:unnamed protein product, partial [Amoebophrya sp. A25]